MQKKGSEDEAIGRSRGGLSTKINVGVDALGNPVRFILTPGQVADILQAEDLIVVFLLRTCSLIWALIPIAFAAESQRLVPKP